MNNTLINDIVPIGTFETLPVTVTGEYLNYPSVVRIGGPFNIHAMMDEFNQVKDSLDYDLLKTMEPYLVDSSLDDLKNNLSSLGWTNHNYKTLSIRELGTTNLLNQIGPITRRTLNHFGNVFRQQYMLAKSKASLKPHIDNKNCEVHGFKIHIPLNCLYTCYVINNDEMYDEFNLEPGYAYYLNSSKMHFVVNHQPVDRVNLAFQLASDFLINAGLIISPTRTVTDYDHAIR